VINCAPADASLHDILQGSSDSVLRDEPVTLRGRQKPHLLSLGYLCGKAAFRNDDMPTESRLHRHPLIDYSVHTPRVKLGPSPIVPVSVQADVGLDPVHKFARYFRWNRTVLATGFQVVT
jgi:hypothetical protein